MSKFLKAIKVLIDTLMAVIIIIGVTFLVLYFIGIKPFVVQTGSMEPAVKTGSISFINQNVKYENIKKNDIIAFSMPSGEKVTHRAIEITEEGIQTKGDANEVIDGLITTKENYIGKNIFSIPKLGYVIGKIQTKRGKIILGTMILMLFLSAILIGEPKKGKHSDESKK